MTTLEELERMFDGEEIVKSRLDNIPEGLEDDDTITMTVKDFKQGIVEIRERAMKRAYEAVVAAAQKNQMTPEEVRHSLEDAYQQDC